MAAPDDAAARFVASMSGAALAEVLTLPTDVAKTRLQIQKADAGTGTLRYSGMFDCLRKIRSEEGAAAMWKGLRPALLRQVCYSTLAMVIYEPVRSLFTRENETAGYLEKLMAGGTAGCLSITVFNPTEVLKTKMMTAAGIEPSMNGVARAVYRAEGLRGFWAGYKPNLARTFLVNAAELGTYDQAKEAIIPFTGDNGFAHVGASAVAGLASAVISTPADVVKTRLMDQAGAEAIEAVDALRAHVDARSAEAGVAGSTSAAPAAPGAPAPPRRFRGMLDCFAHTARHEGFFALYKGFLPIFVRKVMWCSAFFVTFEKVRAAAHDVL
jgi:hypothetical protein